MRRRFWQFIHDRLEQAWHWVYYHKIAPPMPVIDPLKEGVTYRFSYVCGKTGVMTDVIVSQKFSFVLDVSPIPLPGSAR